jgi:hypothetical protein
MPRSHPSRRRLEERRLLRMSEESLLHEEDTAHPEEAASFSAAVSKHVLSCVEGGARHLGCPKVTGIGARAAAGQTPGEGK